MGPHGLRRAQQPRQSAWGLACPRRALEWHPFGASPTIAAAPNPTSDEDGAQNTLVQSRAYTCMYMYMHAHGHMHVQACGHWKGPRSPGSRRRRAGGSRNETGLGRRLGSSSGYWFWNWVKQKKSPVGHTSTCTCTCLLLLPCRLRVGSFRVNEGSCFSLVETSHGTQVHGNGASDGLCSQ